VASAFPSHGLPKGPVVDVAGRGIRAGAPVQSLSSLDAPTSPMPSVDVGTTFAPASSLPALCSNCWQPREGHGSEGACRRP
jgi:hypothetical protein